MSKINNPVEMLPKGVYFDKKTYDNQQLFKFNEVKEKLPSPILSGKSEYIDCYWFAVELAYQNARKPSKESGYVSNFVDAAFNDNIFMWDTAFITMFCNLLHPNIPGICSLDNFYCKQLEDGEIAREMVRESGELFAKWVNTFEKPLYSYFHNSYGYRRLSQIEVAYADTYKPNLGRAVDKNPYLTLDNLNHPIMAWAELESYRQTGDLERLKMVLNPLLQYYKSLWYHIRHENNLFVTDWASMDNSPRNKYLGMGVDISCEMVHFAKCLLEIIDELIKYKKIEEETVSEEIRFLKDSSNSTKQAINELMWDEELGFYFDLKDDGQRAPVKTIAAFWALISGVADSDKAKRLVAWLNDKNTFNRVHRIPVCAADEEGYDTEGGYWKGSVWAPTNTMVIYGLINHGEYELAKEIATNHLENLVKVYLETGTIWEHYPPDSISKGHNDKGDFVGWSGLAPILYLIEFEIGLKADAVNQELTWTVNQNEKLSGCENYWFFGKEANFYAENQTDSVKIKIQTKDSFNITVKVNNKNYHYLVDGDLSVEIKKS